MMDSVQQELADADLPVYIHTLSPGMVLTGRFCCAASSVFLWMLTLAAG